MQKKSNRKQPFLDYLKYNDMWDIFFRITNQGNCDKKLVDVFPYTITCIKSVFKQESVIKRYWQWCKDNNLPYVSIYKIGCGAYENELKYLASLKVSGTSIKNPKRIGLHPESSLVLMKIVDAQVADAFCHVITHGIPDINKQGGVTSIDDEAFVVAVLTKEKFYKYEDTIVANLHTVGISEVCSTIHQDDKIGIKCSISNFLLAAMKFLEKANW